MRIKFILVFFFLLFSKTNVTFAQDLQEIVKLREQLISPWIITFAGKDPIHPS